MLRKLQKGMRDPEFESERTKRQKYGIGKEKLAYRLENVIKGEKLDKSAC